MTSRYYVKPESTDFLTSLCPSPLVTDLVTKQIGIDPDKRIWTFHFEGARQGTTEFWNELAEKIKIAVPEILHVEFEWEEEESLEDYMEQVVKSFAMQPVKYSSPAPSNGNGNGNGERRRERERFTNRNQG